MNVFITGIKSGLGAACSKAFPRSTGIDRFPYYPTSKVVRMIEPSDVFINCAYDDNLQLDLFNAISEKWRGHPKKIVNVSSRIVERSHVDSQYKRDKLALEEASNQYFDDHCKVYVIRPGVMDTPMAAHHKGDKLDPLKVAGAIKWMINSPDYISHVTIEPWNFRQ